MEANLRVGIPGFRHQKCDVCYTWKLNKTTRKGEIVLPRLYWCRVEGQKDWVQCTKENPCKTITIEIAIQGKSGQNLRTRRTRDHTAADNSRQRREMGDGRLATLQWRQTYYFSSLRPEMVVTSGMNLNQGWAEGDQLIVFICECTFSL